jgi:hypothetical protein
VRGGGSYGLALPGEILGKPVLLKGFRKPGGRGGPYVPYIPVYPGPKTSRLDGQDW